MSLFLVLLTTILKHHCNCQTIPNITLHWYNEYCIGGENAILTAGLLLKYTSHYRADVNRTNSTWIDFNSTLSDLEYYLPGDTIPSPINRIEYIFYQAEHGGGGCHCVDIYFSSRPSKPFKLCGRRPDYPRQRCIEWSSGDLVRNCINTINLSKEIPFLMNNSCRDSQNILEVSFDFITYCNNFTIEPLDSLELSIHFTSSQPTEWIPISLIVFKKFELQPRRGYNNIGQIGVIQPEGSTMKHHITLCNFTSVESVQLRWLLSSYRIQQQHRDIWSLDNIKIIQYTPFSVCTHLNESFSENSINSHTWNPKNIRNGKISTCSNDNNYALVFGENVYYPHEIHRNYSSHSVLSDIFSLQCEPYNTVGTAITNVEVSPPEDMLSIVDEAIRTKVLSNMTLVAILNDDNVTSQLSDFGTLLDERNKTIEVLVYIFADIFSEISESYCEPQIFMKAAELGDKVIQLTQALEMPSQDISEALGPTLLFTLDQFVLNCVDPLEYSNNENFAIETMVVNTEMSSVFKFASSNYNQWTPPYVEAILPTQELQNFSLNGYLRITFIVFRNIASILPKESNGFGLVSDVIGISLRCEDEICVTDNITLTDPVRITFHHSDSLISSLEVNQSLTTHCAFLKIPSRITVLKSGMWSSKGCKKNEDLSTTESTTCECTHLTHFGILLSARKLSLSQYHRFRLSIIGYIGVGISCVAMLCTIICFIVFNPNYFCGWNRQAGDPVPIYCRIIAVLLHYFFLVSFMWMLMEGAFLYFALVKVFIANPQKYLLTFTVISYGLPLLYMGCITLPLGFGFSEKLYGYQEACYLNTDSHFIWAFITPVIIIFICNCVFLVMAAIIMWRPAKRQDIKTESHTVLKWIKAIASLTIVMGLTWIVGVFIVEREELLPLAYIYTIMVAFQGFFIFLVLVVFTTSVCDYIRQWIALLWAKLRINTSDTNATVFSNPMLLKDMTPEDFKN